MNTKPNFGSVFVCGDIHCPHDISKLNASWKEQKDLNEDDVLINLGDCGIVYYPKNHEKYKQDIYWRNWLGEKKYTFAFVDGNHENHEMLAQLPVEEKWGGKVGVITTNSKSLYHLKRGEIYTINGKTFFVLGGAESQDKEDRINPPSLKKSRYPSKKKPFIQWWEGELYTKEEETYILNQIKKQSVFDYVLSHTCPMNIGYELANLSWFGPYGDQSKYNRYLLRAMDPIAKFLEFVEKEIEFGEWHFGHWHFDKRVNKQFMVHYNNEPYKLF